MKGIIYKIKKNIVFSLFVLVIALVISPKISPDYPLLFRLKRAQEKTFFLLKRSPDQKIKYYHSLLNIRLQELKHIVSIREYDLILSTALRYSTTAGELTELLMSNQPKEQISATLTIFTSHQNNLNDLVESYPKQDSHHWKYIQDSSNYLDIYTKQLSQWTELLAPFS